MISVVKILLRVHGSSCVYTNSRASVTHCYHTNAMFNSFVDSACKMVCESTKKIIDSVHELKTAASCHLKED